jgi:hypothetical protein
MGSIQNIRLVFALAAAIALSACNGNQNIKVDGPDNLDDGVPGTYTIEYTTAVPVGADRNVQFDVEANGTKVATNVPMLIPGGARTANSSPFNLTCTEGGGTWTMTGPSGSATGSSPFDMHGEMVLTGGNSEGVDKAISCKASKPVSARIVNQFDTQRTTMYNGISETFRVELTMSDPVNAVKTYNYSIEEYDSPFGHYFISIGETLQNTVTVTVPVGSNIGHGAFELTCNRNGTNWDLVGADDTSKNEDFFQLWADGVKNSYHHNTELPTRLHVIHCDLNPPAGYTGSGTTGGSGGSSSSGGN